MTAKFSPTVLHGSGWTYIRLAGVIDEDNRLMDLISEIRGQTLYLDLAEIERINSCGVRDWINWLTAVERTHAATLMVDCSPTIVAQLNLVGNFSVHAGVVSFRAPYYCETCDIERSQELQVADLAGVTGAKAPPLTCEQCGKPMAFDDIEESFFAFLGEVQAPARPPQLDKVLRAARRLLGDAESTTMTGADSGMVQLVELSSSDEERVDRWESSQHNIPTKPRPMVADPPPAAKPSKRSLTRNDTVFYLAVGVLIAVLIVVIYHIATP